MCLPYMKLVFWNKMPCKTLEILLVVVKISGTLVMITLIKAKLIITILLIMIIKNTYNGTAGNIDVMNNDYPTI